jgi:CHAT domain-containing protein/tetratricopeptide (TPR) repeat protein
MKKLYLQLFLLVLVFAHSSPGQNVNIDSIRQLVESEHFTKLEDSLKADAFRRLSIDNIRKSSQKARKYAFDFLDLANKTGVKRDKAIALNLIGVTYASSGNLEKALEYYLSSLSIRKELKQAGMISNTMNNIGTIYVRLNNFSEGMKYYHDALEIRRQNNDETGIAQTLNNIGVSFKMLEQYDSALYYLEQSLIIKRKLNDKELIASSLNNLGEIASLKGDRQKAQSYFNESYDLRREIGDRYGMARTCANLSDFYLQQEKYPEAFHQLQNAIILSTDDFDDPDIYANPGSGCGDIDYNSVELLNRKAEIFSTLHQMYPDSLLFLKAELDIRLHIIDFLDQIRKSYSDEKSKLYLMENNRQLYSKAIVTAIKMFLATDDPAYKAIAFEVAERGKANILLNQISENAAKLNLKLPDSLLKAETNLKKDIARLQKQIRDLEIEGATFNDSLRKIKSSLFEKQQVLENHSRKLEEGFPEFYQLKYNRNNCSLEDVQSHLRPDELFLEYHIAGTELFIFIVTTGRNSILQVKISESFFGYIDTLNNFLTGGPGANPSKLNAGYCDAAHELYKILIEIVENYFDKQKLIIIPDGQLFYLPFDVLLTQKPGDSTNRYSTLPYLIKKHPVNYSYSASMYLNSLKHPQAKYNNDFIAFAMSFKKEKYLYSASNLTPVVYRGNETLAELTGVKDEVNDILKIIDGKALFDEEATEYRFKFPGNSYKVLHIATHGIIDNENPMFSKLIFSEDTLHNEDGNLYTWELFSMKMNAEMAVLSACNTGYGKLRPGEGMMTLARGFLYAGIPSMVISLWNVNDVSTAEIMTRFYHYLNLGLEKETALQKAKLDYLRDADDITANPYFWGGFIHLGNNKSLNFGNTDAASRPLILSGIIMIGVVLILTRRKFRRRNKN